MSKLLHNGVRGVMQCMTPQCGKQYVSIKNCNSSTSNITLGVPQSSVFAPVRFLLYINYMYRSLNQMHFVLFKSDGGVVLSCTSNTLKFVAKLALMGWKKNGVWHPRYN